MAVQLYKLNPVVSRPSRNGLVSALEFSNPTYDDPLSSFAFNDNLRHHTEAVNFLNSKKAVLRYLAGALQSSTVHCQLKWTNIPCTSLTHCR